MEKSIVVIAEHLEGNIRPITFELIEFAQKLGKLISVPLKAVILGHGIEHLAQDISRKTGVDVTVGEFSEPVIYNSQVYKSVLADFMNDLDPSFICIGHTSMGLDFAPGLSVRMKASCITGVNRMEKKDAVVFSRAIANGKINAWMCPETIPCILTVQPGIFGLNDSTCEKNMQPGLVSVKNVSLDPLTSRNKGIAKTSGESSDLNEAKIIVAAGRGIGKKENLSKVHDLALLFPGSKVAGSRPMIDMGWMEYKYQVGITGAVVTPELYIACGISGSSQHIAGMGGSKFIVAINNDANASIFNIADVCIPVDVLQFIDAFERRRKESMG